MALEEKDLELINQEENVLKETFTSLLDQEKEGAKRLSAESSRARSLTSELVTARRVEDKVQLASDEAVAHKLRDMKGEDNSTIATLIERPYFGRIILEETANGRPRTVEYKIGYHANPDCRIIDWRKAPLSKLFYEYKEGDHYCEEILGQEREGRVSLRHTVEVKRDDLLQLSSGRGTFRKSVKGWELASGPEARRIGSKPNELPNVLSLITAEQFRAITEEATTAVIIQGVAGSGKTTVALHRLAWLLHGENSSLKPIDCQVLVKTQTLHRYISGALPSIGVTGVPISSFSDWAGKMISSWRNILGLPALKFLNDAVPYSLSRLKFSQGLLSAIEEELIKRSAEVIRDIDAAVPWTELPPGAKQLWDTLRGTDGKTLSIVLALKNSLYDATHKIPASNPKGAALSAALKTIDGILVKFGRVENHLLSTLISYRRILELDETKLIDAEMIHAYRVRIESCINKGEFDSGDEALLLFILISLLGGPINEKGKAFRFGHIVLDEAQDFSAVHYAIIMVCINGPKDLTLVGDIAQSLEEGNTFPGWEKLRQYWHLSDESSRFISLAVAHRSTLPIMRLADHALGEARTHEGRPGKAPRYVRFKRSSDGMKRIIEWLSEVRRRYPTTLTAVITGSREQSKMAHSLLAPTFGNEVRIGDSESLTFESGIAVIDAKSAKGLEFYAVLIWNPTDTEYPDTELGRRYLYTAMTRAEEHLLIVSWDKPSRLLPATSSPLVRGEDYTIDET